ncbi:phage tail protein, partial [Escherichia coli]|nr:phage tail protein [Escherichia coli]EGN6573570.1 phage tail protein [Escherichia coli]EMC4036451.1 phage tail protein [Escherichia coli]HBA7535198.1 phage tail protein [Escherichia coli]HBA8915700.1 phage tail protein [Escherichia coli]
MFHVDNNSGVANMPALAPAQSNTTTWFTEGDGQKGISWIGQDWLNILQAELLNILAEANIQPDKAQLNQLTLSIKAIIAANAFSRKNNLKEIADAGADAQRLARGYLGLGTLATKNSLGPGDVNALAKDQNLSDLDNAGTARNNLDVYSRSEGDNRYLRREQNGADIPDKGAFIDN